MTTAQANAAQSNPVRSGLPFTVPDRVLANRGVTRGVPATTMHLEAVRDHLKALAEKQEAEDHERTLDQLHVSFIGGHMHAKWLGPKGPEDVEFLVTDNAASQLASEVLPSRFFAGLRELAQMDEGGSKLATMSWGKFANKNGGDPRLVRTVLMRIGGRVHRVIRSCHSQNYAPYANLEFVQDILDNAGQFASLPVLGWRVTDTGMRLRFAGVDQDGIRVHEPIPMIEAWNSEVGRRRVGLRGGMFKLVCTNGMGHWNEKTEYQWIHRGDSARIKAGVQGAFTNLITAANGVVSAYNEALNVAIDDAYAWMEQELRRETSERVIRAATDGMKDPTTTQGGSLASVIDAVTLIAQNESDMYDQYELERIAASLLQRGRSEALRHGGRIPVER
jgi:hypothetical protein